METHVSVLVGFQWIRFLCQMNHNLGIHLVDFIVLNNSGPAIVYIWAYFAVHVMVFIAVCLGVGGVVSLDIDFAFPLVSVIQVGLIFIAFVKLVLQNMLQLGL